MKAEKGSSFGTDLAAWRMRSVLADLSRLVFLFTHPSFVDTHRVIWLGMARKMPRNLETDILIAAVFFIDITSDDKR
jgi:hypothetical protein